MFNSPNVSAFLQNLKLTADGDDVLARGTFYITPIYYALAHEVDAHLADRLFRKQGVDWKPCAEVPTIGFDIKVDPCSLAYAVHTEVQSGRGLIPHVAIDKIRAFKLFADDPNFTLAFDCQFRCDDQAVMWQIIHRMKKPLLLSFQPLQGQLEYPPAALLCEICEEPATHRTKPGKSLVCEEHIAAYVGEEVEPIDPDYEAKAAAKLAKTLEASITQAKAKKKAAKKKRKTS